MLVESLGQIKKETMGEAHPEYADTMFHLAEVRPAPCRKWATLGYDWVVQGKGL